mmetsp:Transcript_1101/g.1284  ORF Transcript_1101/g.1284 Transcript_1101/m.1284 type:complete len:151 (-) Transcript_1101:1418-1870(-)|eukprot:CAMPEP_0197860960 /NCGR_PEP_ID=MMETSP1438-20131217/36688_1 /TAXON_ID=1461541 /ORGANISM="Pterosperma sp., Strain CCMP1384" /LENGTH=150 /DNA_ID=CAMNT_0043477987 /DNA_START=73 /DNA_END=525 /DNA_ORIENTATION=+
MALTDEEKAKKREEIMAQVAAARADQEKKEVDEQAKRARFFGSHTGITCDGCEVVPITGYRYSCTKCANHDLCEVCYESWEKGKLPHATNQRLSLVASDHEWKLNRTSGFKSIGSNNTGATEKNAPKVKPNDVCHCGSGKKFKKCCMKAT